MSRMKAVQVISPGGNFELVERKIPEPARNQVLIKVEACGICHSDALVREGNWPGIQYPRVPGHEIAGRIDAVGADVTNWKPGQRVGVGWHGGHELIVVGAGMDPIAVTPIQLIQGGKALHGWASGIATDSEDTMQFSALTGVRPMIEKYPLDNAAEAYEQMISGKARFRVVLTMN